MSNKSTTTKISDLSAVELFEDLVLMLNFDPIALARIAHELGSRELEPEDFGTRYAQTMDWALGNAPVRLG